MIEKKTIYTVEVEGQDKALSEIGKLRKANANLKRENQEYNKALKEGRPLSKEQTKQYERNNAQIKANSKSMNQLTKEITSSGKQAQNMRSILTEKRRELQRMAVAGDTSSEAYINLRNEAAQLQDSIDRVSTEIKLFADDALVINTVVDATRGLTGAMQLAQGVTTLLGVENEKLVEVIARLQALQSISNGLQQVSNMLQKESRLLLLSKIGAQKIATVSTLAYTKAQGAAIIATQGLTTAVRGFSKSIYGIPVIGWLLAAITGITVAIRALIRNWDALRSTQERIFNWIQNKIPVIGFLTQAVKELANMIIFWTDISGDNTEELKRNDEALRRVLNSTRNFLREIQDTASGHERYNSKLQHQINLMKALGEDQDKIIEKENELLRIKLEQAQQAEFELGLIDKTSDAYAEAVERRISLQRRLEIFEAEQLRRRREAEEEAEQKRLERIQKEEEREEKRRQDELKNIEEQHQKEVDLLEGFELEADEKYEEDREKELERRNEAREEYLNWLEQRRLDEFDEFDLREQQLENFLNQNLITEERYAELMKEVDEDRLEHYKQVQHERAQASLQATHQLIDNLKNLADSETNAAKWAQRLAIVATAIEIKKGFAKTASVGFPQNIPLLIQYAAQTAGLIGRMKSLSVPSTPEFAKGGIIGGKPHSQGGTKFVGSDGSQFEAERDEYLAVVNKYDAPRAAMLDSINQKHGNPLFSNNSGYFARGGVMLPTPRDDFDRLETEEILREAVQMIGEIPVVISERAITGTQKRVARILETGDL